MASDPSDGKCDPLPGNYETECRNRVKSSFESWIAQIEANYEQCVSAAVHNNDPAKPYTDPQEAFADEGKLVFEDWGCNTDLAGCLYDAELRPFCEIDDFSEGSSCEDAENPIDSQATGDGGSVDSSTGGGGVIDPFGDVETLVYCSPPTTCWIGPELKSNVETHFNVFYDEGVELTLGTYATGVTGLKVSGLDAGEESKGLFDAFGITNLDVITHVNNTALDSGSDVWAVIDNMDGVSQWNITVRRPARGSYATLNYTISLAVSIGSEHPPNVAHGTSGGNAEETQGGRQGCGCAHGRGAGPGVMAIAVLLGMCGVRRRRRRVLR